MGAASLFSAPRNPGWGPAESGLSLSHSNGLRTAEPSGCPDSASAAPPLGTDRLLSEASGLPLLAVQPSSCGHCPVLEADSARPVEPALPSAQAPHPLASRTLNTFCFERKQTLWKLPLGAQTASLAPSFGGWRTSQAFQGKLASEATCGLAAPHPGGGRVGS